MMGTEERELTPEEKRCIEVCNEVAEMTPGYDRRVENCMYREDYQDFVLLLSEDYVAIIRGRLIEVYEEDDSGNVRREIEGVLKRAEPYQDYDGEEFKEEKDQEI